MKQDSCITVALLLSALSLSACGTPSPVSGPTGAQDANRQIRLASERSWMAPGASKGDLLYVTDSISNVYVYTYPKGRLVGTLTGFTRPLGECVDPGGDIFVVSEDSQSGPAIIYEYAHGGTQPIATLNDPTFAEGCAFDRSTGNLAVVGGYSYGGYYYGDAAVFNHASGKPTIYDSRTFPPFELCGYDNKGNLYASARSAGSSEAVLIRLRRGSTVFQQVLIDQIIYAWDAPASVQWDGKYVTVSSYAAKEPTFLYRLEIKKSNATVVGTTILSSQRNNFKSGQVSIQAHRALGSDYFKDEGGVDSWPYPAGGNPRRVIPNKRIERNFHPFGIAVSPQ